jgi:hypothetical protein
VDDAFRQQPHRVGIDKATSALDSASEIEIQRALEVSRTARRPNAPPPGAFAHICRLQESRTVALAG